MFDITNVFSWIKKNLRPSDLIRGFALIAAYCITRLTLLDRYPIFSDEAIYIHWAKIAKMDASWRFISLTDGKQPLQTWGTIFFLKFFPDNALLAGRLFAFSTGFVALIGTSALLYYLFGKKAAFWGSLFYILTPYFLFYDRLALVDSGVNAGFIWILFLSILLIRTIRLDVALFYGLIGGITLLAKSSAQLFIGLSVFAPILEYKKTQKGFGKKILNYFILYGIGVVIAIAIYNVQRLSPFLHYVTEKNKTFVMTPSEFLKTPFAYFPQNVANVPLYLLWESGFILPLLGVFGYFMLLKKNWRLAVYLLLWIFIPYGAISFFSKTLFPRYIIFLPTLFLIGAAYFFSHVKKKTIAIIAFIIFLVSVIYFDYTIIADYKNIPLPPVDRGQYLEAWPAGWGAREIIEYAREESKEKPVILLAEGNFGMSGDVLDTFLKRTDKISIRGFWPLDIKNLQDNQKELDKNYVYIVMSHVCEYAEPCSLPFHPVPKDWPIKLVKRYDKPGGKSALYLFELTR